MHHYTALPVILVTNSVLVCTSKQVTDTPSVIRWKACSSSFAYRHHDSCKRCLIFHLSSFSIRTSARPAPKLLRWLAVSTALTYIPPVESFFSSSCSTRLTLSRPPCLCIGSATASAPVAVHEFSPDPTETQPSLEASASPHLAPGVCDGFHLDSIATGRRAWTLDPLCARRALQTEPIVPPAAPRRSLGHIPHIAILTPDTPGHSLHCRPVRPPVHGRRHANALSHTPVYFYLVLSC